MNVRTHGLLSVTSPNGVDVDQAVFDDLATKIQPLLVKHACCAICLKETTKNIEHLPPKASGNVKPLDTVVIDPAQSKDTGELTFVRGDKVGFRSRRSLCAKCNERTGVWYASDYRDLSEVAEEKLGGVADNSICEFRFSGRPSAVVKQVLSFMCSTCGPSLVLSAPVVRELLLKNKFRAVPREFDLWAYLTDTPGGKETGFAIVYGKDQGHQHIVAEFSHKPLGWILSWRSPPIVGLTDVTNWFDMSYKQVTDFTVRLPKLPSCSPYPLDFRTHEEIISQGRR